MNTKVVGINYEGTDGAPIVVLKGAGEQAEAVLAQARERDTTPVVRDAALVNALYRIPVDAPVSRELFPVMAALIAHVMQIDKAQDRMDEHRVDTNRVTEDRAP